MHLPIAQRLVIAWFALLGVLFAVLSPTISQAMVPALSTAGEIQVCTARGIVSVSVHVSVPDDTSPTLAHAVEHCVFCNAHGALPDLLPTSAFVIPILRQELLAILVFQERAAQLLAWPAANPRAPPFPV